MKIVIIGIGIAIIGALFIMQDFGSPPILDQVQNQPTSQPTLEQTPAEIKKDCDPSYPDVCIPSPPPDLDCGEISHRNFTVLPPDPHRFDGDKNGIGCES